MRISALGYAPASRSNQNDRTKTQKAPAFNGWLRIVSNDIDPFDLAPVKQFVESLPHPRWKELQIIEGRKVADIDFDFRFNEAAKGVIESLREVPNIKDARFSENSKI